MSVCQRIVFIKRLFIAFLRISAMKRNGLAIGSSSRSSSHRRLFIDSMPAAVRKIVHSGPLNPPYSPRFEVGGMYRAELEQLNHGDKFWGKDKESEGAEDERGRMDIENRRSFFLERQHRQAILHSNWQQEFAAEREAKAYESALAELNDRKAYLKFMFSSRSSVDVMKYQWKSKAIVNCIVNKSQIGENTSNDGFRGTEIVEILNRPVSLSLPEPNQQTKFSVHLDGLQQTRALTLNGSATKPEERQPAGANLGSALRSRSLTSVAENYLQSDSMVNEDEELPSPPVRKDVKARGREFNESNLSLVLKSIGGKQVKLPANLAPRKVEAWDGHPKYKWDQELMLKAAFSLLSGDRNVVSQSELSSTIAKDADIRDLLRFTVFGAWLKRKEYHRFLEMFNKKATTNQEEFDSPDDLFGLKVVSLDEWMETAHRYASESAVPRRWVRTDDEHRTQVVPVDPAALPDDKAPGWFALQSRQLQDCNERAAAMSRALSPGECVWGLCGGGITWLPAVVEAACYAAAEPGGQPTVSYDLQYFMTSRDLRKGRTDASSRPFLTLPSEIQSDVLRPKKNQSEKRVCESAFDVVDVEKVGRVNVTILLQALRSAEMQSVVMSSVALSMLVFGTSSTLAASSNVEIRFPLATALEEFSAASGNEIEKLEFVEFCMYATDLSKYNQTYLELGKNRSRKLFQILI